MSKIANRKGQVFLPSYTERNNYIVKSTKGAVYAHCNLCNCDFTVSHGGWNSVLWEDSEDAWGDDNSGDFKQ